jgi:hypothetical protein
MSPQSGYTTWAIARKRFIGFIPLSIGADNLAFSWIRPGWEVSVALGSSCCMPRTLFINLWGPYINGYAFGDIDGLVKIVERVQKEGRRIPDLQAAYPGVTFKSQSDWMSANTDLANGMNQLISTLKGKKDEIRRQRIERGMEEKFSKLTSKELPSR